MGKRELVLIAVFVVLGAVLYRATAPDAPEGRGFSLRQAIDGVRREIGPTREYLGDEREETIPIGADVSELRLARVHKVDVRGSEGEVARLRTRVYSTGLDEREAREFARRVRPRRQQSGGVLSLEFDYPPEARQRAELVLEVPSRLRLHLSRVRATAARDVAGAELDETTGEVVLERIAGAVRGSHAGGAVTVERAGSIDLKTRRAELTLARVAGEVRVEASGGSLTARGVGSALSVDGNRVEVALDAVAGPIAADLTQGTLRADGVSSPVRVDARGTEIRLALARPVRIIASTTDEDIELRLPADGGFTLDADARDGEIRLPPGAPAVTSFETTRRARGPLRAGGPPLELRTTHGDITIR